MENSYTSIRKKQCWRKLNKRRDQTLSQGGYRLYPTDKKLLRFLNNAMSGSKQYFRNINFHNDVQIATQDGRHEHLRNMNENNQMAKTKVKRKV